jgi:hypothetical protein
MMNSTRPSSSPRRPTFQAAKARIAQSSIGAAPVLEPM